MEQICGTIEVRYLYEESKSEGNHAFLITDGQEYKLARPDVFPINDMYFMPFNQKYVCVEGDVHGVFLTVSNIVLMSTNEIEKEDKNENMQ